MVRLLAVFLLCLLAAAPGGAGASDLASGQPVAPRHGDVADDLKPLAIQGNHQAQYRLANLYRDGQGVPRDETAAVNWYQRAAEGGVWAAAFELGMLYWGQSQASMARQPDDLLVRAHMWLGIATATEHGGCVEVSAPLRDVVAQTMTPAQLARAQELTKAWLTEHRPVGGAKIAAADQPSC